MEPEGRAAVERQTVSGWGTAAERWAARNQVWNWVKGEGERELRERVPLRYCSACGEEFWPAGATVVGGGVRVSGEGRGVGRDARGAYRLVWWVLGVVGRWTWCEDRGGRGGR